MKKGLRQITGAVLLIIALGVPSCMAFKDAVAAPPVTHQSVY